MIISLDPGQNLGVAFVEEGGRLLWCEVITLEILYTLDVPPSSTFVVGDGTGHEKVLHVLRDRGLPYHVMDEKGTTLEARDLYFKNHPPKGLLRFLPKGMWAAPRNLDDYAAYAIALRYLEHHQSPAS
ncbi:MAG: Holliday junction resolvase RuvX [Trueperaceae bacterium]